MLPTGSVRLDTHAPVAELQGYSEGEWWVQDAAATLPARLLRPRPGMRVVDLCAAPGGKAAELAASGADLTTVDRSAERLKLLAANFKRLGLEFEIVVADALAVDLAPFDGVLLDAPCLATGTIRRHPDVAWIKRPGDLAALVKLQAALLDKAIALGASGRRHRLLRVLARGGGGRSSDRRPAAAKPRRAAPARRAGRGRRPRRVPDARWRLAHPPLSLMGRQSKTLGSRSDFSPRGSSRPVSESRNVRFTGRTGKETGFSHAREAIRRRLRPDTWPGCRGSMPCPGA